MESRLFRYKKFQKPLRVSGVPRCFYRHIHDKALRRLAQLAHFRKCVEKMNRRSGSFVRFKQGQRMAASILSGKFGISIDGGAAQGNALKLKFSSLDAVYTALSGDKRFKLVSSPTMRVKSGASARFVAGSEVPVLGAITYQSTGQAVQNVEYKSSGVILDLKPQVSEDSTDLTIFQQISSFVPTTTGVNQSPTLLKRELQTQVSVKADEMIVLGGLEESQGTQSEQGLSFLPKFFRTSGDDQTKTEIMVVLHAQKI